MVGGVPQEIPKAVLGGATLVMFGTVAVAWVKIVASEPLDRRRMSIMAVSFGMGLGVSRVPEALVEAPDLVQAIFGSAVTTGGLAAILLSIVLPKEVAAESEPEAVAAPGE